MKCFLFLSLVLLGACASPGFHSLPALPFSVELPPEYGSLESSSAYVFSPEGGPATLVFEKTATERAFFELFDGGYEELTEKSSGVWVICEKDNWENCYVQNMDFLELYPLHIRSDETLNGEGKAKVLEVLHTLRAD